jgi:phosphate transport system permease protein
MNDHVSITRPISTRRRAWNGTMRALLYAAAALICALLVFLIGYILYRGVPSLSLEFLTSEESIINDVQGILPAIVNTVYVVFWTLLIILPLGVGSAIYLTEYAANRKLVSIIEFATETLSGMPSIIFALVGMMVFCQTLGLGTSLIAGALALVMMTLPTIIRTTQESLKTVPQSYREGALALGSGKWHMIRTVVLPGSIDGIVTGCILAIGRIVGESAVLMFTAGMSMSMANFGGETIGKFLSNFFSAAGSTLTVSLYVYAKERADFDQAFAVAVVLLVIAFVINIAAKLAGKKLKKN